MGFCITFTSKSVKETPVCDHSYESYWAAILVVSSIMLYKAVLFPSPWMKS